MSAALRFWRVAIWTLIALGAFAAIGLVEEATRAAGT